MVAGVEANTALSILPGALVHDSRLKRVVEFHSSRGEKKIKKYIYILKKIIGSCKWVLERGGDL